MIWYSFSTAEKEFDETALYTGRDLGDLMDRELTRVYVFRLDGQRAHACVCFLDWMDR